MTRYVFAWTAFFTGLGFLAYDITHWTITGAAVAGVWFLVVWLWLIGGFDPEFWEHDEEAQP